MAFTKSTIALVTGANKGIGRATAIQLARDPGYTVIIGSRNLDAGEAVASELRSQGHQATGVQLDLTSDESIAAAVKTIDQKYGRLDVLINNAGVLLDQVSETPTAVLTRVAPKLPTRELFDRTFATNITGTAVLTEALLPLLRKANGAPRVMFISTSMSSLANATDKELSYYNFNCMAYDCSKAAVNMLALQYVRLLEDIGGHVDILCPGFVSTDMTYHTPVGTTPEEAAAHIVNVATTFGDDKNGKFTSPYGEVPW